MLTPPVAREAAPTPVLATVMAVCTVFAVCSEMRAAFCAVAATSAAVAAAEAAPDTMLPMPHPSEATQSVRLQISEAASLASLLLMPWADFMWSASALTILSIAPVSFKRSDETAMAAPAIANPAARPPVTTVSTAAATTATIAPIQLKARLQIEAFSASFIFLMDLSICSMRSLCSASRLPFCISRRSLAISVCRSWLSSCRYETSFSRLAATCCASPGSSSAGTFVPPVVFLSAAPVAPDESAFVTLRLAPARTSIALLMTTFAFVESPASVVA